MPTGAPRERIIRGAPSLESGGIGAIAPFQFVTTGEDHLRVRVWTTDLLTVHDCAVAIGLRTIDSAGQIQVTTEQLLANTNAGAAGPTTKIITLAPGALLNLSIRYLYQGYPDGATYATAELIRGADPASATVIGQLLGDYINVSHSIGWPGSPIRSWTEGSGFYRTQPFTSGGAGFEAAWQVAFGTVIRVIEMHNTLITSAVAGNRFPTFSFFSTLPPPFGNHYIRLPQLVTVPAATGVELNYAAGYGSTLTTSPPRYFGPLPDDILIPYPHELRTNTVGLLGGDQWTTGFVTFEELLFPLQP